jgi:transcriptional accessory protein Tex/SPT6
LLEVPTIWLYKRDLLPDEISRDQLWEIFWFDLRWRSANILRKKLQDMIAEYNTVIDTNSSDFDHLQYYGRLLEQEWEEDVLNDISSSLGFFARRHPYLVTKYNEHRTEEANRKDTYSKYSHSEEIKKFSSKLCLPSYEIGSAIKFNLPILGPNCDASTLDDAAVEILQSTLSSQNTQQLFGNSALVMATELAYDPCVRASARAFLKLKCTISTYPTEKGKEQILPFSELYGLHRIEKKPVTDFFSSQGLDVFMRIIDAEKKELIEVKFNFDPTGLWENLRLMQLFFPATPVDLDPHPQARKTWDFARLTFLQTFTDKFLIPLILKDIRADLIKRGSDRIIDCAMKKFERQLEQGPMYPSDRVKFVEQLLRECPNRPHHMKIVGIYVCPEKLCIDAVCIDHEANVTAVAFMPSLSTTNWEETLKMFLFENRPTLIVLNKSSFTQGDRVKKSIEERLLSDVNDTIKIHARISEDEATETKYEAYVSEMKDDNNKPILYYLVSSYIYIYIF